MLSFVQVALPLVGRVLKSCVIVVGRMVMLISGRASFASLAKLPIATTRTAAIKMLAFNCVANEWPIDSYSAVPFRASKKLFDRRK